MTTAPKFFDFLADLQYAKAGVSRMNWRYRHIVEPVAEEFSGARVLDLGSHDGRWPYAFAASGASVVGIEARTELTDIFNQFPDAEIRSRVRLFSGDFIDEMERLHDAGEQFDIVARLGVYYHTMQHYRMLTAMARFRPKLIIIDSAFAYSEAPIIAIRSEATDSKLNTVAQVTGQTEAPVGRPSRSGMELMAASVGYGVDWDVPQDERDGVIDYFPAGKARWAVALQRFYGRVEAEQNGLNWCSLLHP